MVAGLRMRNGMTTSMLPAGVTWSFNFEPSVAIQAAGLRRFAHNLSDMREPLTKAVKEVMQPSIRKNFNVGGRPEQWEPLSDDTIRAKTGDSRVLIDTGNLRFAASAFFIWTITDNSATVRDLPPFVWYGKVHQAGAKKAGRGGLGDFGIGHVNIPARPFILIQVEDAKAIDEIFEDWLAKRAVVDVR